MFRNWATLVVVTLAMAWLGQMAGPVRADEALDNAFEALKTYQWGQDRSMLAPIDKAVAASYADASARKELEKRLAVVLTSDAPQAAKDVVCRQLSLVGTSASVPALAALLTDEKLSHMARYALERIPDAQAVQALRESLPKLDGQLKVGVINSLGVRRDGESTASLVALLSDSDPQIVAAAAGGLGAIGSPEAAKALDALQSDVPPTLRLVAADAYLACAERLLADGKKLQAIAIYRSLSKADQPKHVRVAATRGLLAAARAK